MNNPPTAESLKDSDGGTDRAPIDEEEDNVNLDPSLENDFYKNGVRPQYLQIHRIINYKKTNRGNEWYLCKWRDLGYEFSTWEMDGGDIAMRIHDWKKQADLYWTHKKVCSLLIMLIMRLFQMSYVLFHAFVCIFLLFN